jgi:hypothetical protein
VYLLVRIVFKMLLNLPMSPFDCQSVLPSKVHAYLGRTPCWSN